MRQRRQTLAHHVFRRSAQQFVNPRTDEGKFSLQVQHRDHFRKVRDQLADEFLFLPQAFFHFNAFGNVDQRALNANHLAKRIADRKSGSQTMNFATVFTAEQDVHVLYRTLLHNPAYQMIPLRRVGVPLPEAARFQIFLEFVTQHAHQRRVGVEQFAFGRREKNSFAQRLKKFGETRFWLMLRSHVARPAAHRLSAAFFIDQLQPAIVIAELLRVSLETHWDSPLPASGGK